MKLHNLLQMMCTVFVVVRSRSKKRRSRYSDVLCCMAGSFSMTSWC